MMEPSTHSDTHTRLIIKVLAGSFSAKNQPCANAKAQEPFYDSEGVSIPWRLCINKENT